MENKDLSNFDFDDEIDGQSDVIEHIDELYKSDSRRKVENYREQRELERLINDDFDYLDDIA